MTREIKFRVWNGFEMEHNIIVGKFGVFYVNPGDKKDGLNPQDTASLTPHTTKYYDGTPAMQYTGIKDKTDKEIYEGDIVKDDRPGTTVKKIIYDPQGGAFILKCDKYYAELKATYGDGITYRIDHLEVIGNIFKNPELLNL